MDRIHSKVVERNPAKLGGTVFSKALCLDRWRVQNDEKGDHFTSAQLHSEQCRSFLPTKPEMECHDVYERIPLMIRTNRVRVLGQTNNRVTVQEASSYSAGVFLLVIEGLSIVSFAAKRHSGVADWIILAVVYGVDDVLWRSMVLSTRRSPFHEMTRH